MLFTTLNIIRNLDPCEEGWERLLRGLDKTKADDEPLSILTIAKISGYWDTRWLLARLSQDFHFIVCDHMQKWQMDNVDFSIIFDSYNAELVRFLSTLD